MDLGIQNKSAIVCAASKGLGRACAISLAREGVKVTICARTEETLIETVREIKELTGADVTYVACDINTAEGRDAVLAACPEPDILVNNAGGPPPGDFRNWDETDWQSALNANMVSPILLIKAVVDGMITREFGRIVNITSASVKNPIPTLGLSNGARAGLTGFLGGLSRQTVAHNVTINNILPGPFATDRLFSTTKAVAKAQGVSFDEAYAARAKTNPSGRFGYPEEFGEACAFFCGVHAGYITGQNLVLDGGDYKGTL